MAAAVAGGGRWRSVGGARRVAVHRGVAVAVSRNVASRTPSMSRPSPSNVRRPSGGQIANNRPCDGQLADAGKSPGYGAGNRPGAGNIANRPNAGTRPSGAMWPIGRMPYRPGAGTRPGAGAGSIAGSRPAAGARPSTRDVQNFLDLPNAGSGNVGGSRPSSGLGNAAAIAGGALAGGAAAEFLRIVRAMRFRTAGGQVGRRNRVDAGLPGNLEIGSTRVFPGSRGIVWMPVYRGSPATESTPACPGKPGNRVDRWPAGTARHRSTGTSW